MTRAAPRGRPATFAWDVVFRRDWPAPLRPLVQRYANGLGAHLVGQWLPFDTELAYSVGVVMRAIERAIETGWIDDSAVERWRPRARVLEPFRIEDTAASWRRRWRDPELFRDEVRRMLRRAVGR